jgi:hypothetical protein
MSSFVNYFAPLAQDERTPITREPVKNAVRNRRSIARVARRRTIERRRTEDAQVEHNESLTRNIKSNLYLASRTDSFRQGARLLRRGEQIVPRRYVKSAHWLKVGRDEGYFAAYQGAYLPIEFNTNIVTGTASSTATSEELGRPYQWPHSNTSSIFKTKK